MAKAKATRSPPSVVANDGPVPVPPQVTLVPTQSNNKNSMKKVVRKAYTSDGVEDHDVFWLPRRDYEIMILVTIVAAIVRLFRIYQPSSVVFDEVHFGGFASKYIKGKFFMDVHPPLAKLLLTLAGFLAGFDGNFDFKEIGKDYLEPGVPYVAMRMLPAICGILLVPTAFLTLKAAGCRTSTATLGAGLIIFENGLLTQARLILLDSPLMIMTAFTALAFTSFTNQHEQGPAKAFKPNWWFWLVMTGLGLGATASVKWVGLFTIAWVGSLTIVQLWVLLGDYKNVTPRLYAKHLLARLFCLIMIPVAFYMGMFYIHFLCLVNPGEGDGFMSSEFQSTLNSKAMQDVPADVAYGSRVSIRHWNTHGGYLHSHPLMYPGGSKQQQITLYPHKDTNNDWLIENITQPLDANNQSINGSFAWDKITPPTFLKHGDTIKLWHIPTKRRLHSHDVRPPVTEAEWQNEVSAYGHAGFPGDANDYFRVEIVKSKSDGDIAKKRVRTIETKFRLIHTMTGCALFSHKVKLPEWASEQQEVTCAKQGTLPNSIWYIEQNNHPAFAADVEKVNYKKPGFLGKFWELQKVMWRTNAGLVDSHAWDSRPQSWPILRRGINFWGKEHRQIYLIGNPLIWWSSSAAVATFIAFYGLALLRWQRGYRDFDDSVFKRLIYETGTFVLGWALHYFPFFLMQRQLFLHHYFPALYFAVLALCQLYDFTTSRVPGVGLKERKWIGATGAIVFLVLSAVVFALYSPLAYGDAWTKSACKKVQLFKTWDWDCNNFLVDINDYKYLSKSATAVPTTGAGSKKNKKKGKKVAPKGPVKEPETTPPAVKKPNAKKKPAAKKPAAKKPAVPNPAAQKHPEAQVPVVEQPEPPMSDAPVYKPAASHSAGQSIVSREEKVEYRDQNGNILNPDQVKALEGKVSFKTRYETRTRLVDASGNQLDEQVVEAGDAGVAPPHPDVEGADSETPKAPEAESKAVPASEGNVKDDIAKEAAVENAVKGETEPASEVNDATA